MSKVLKDADVRALMAKEGAEPPGSSPDEFGAYFKIEADKYAEAIKAAGAQVE
jgi:tripartite-type tricarboxylate transporter receptor subunit TctC